MLDGAESSFLDLRDPSHLDFEYHQQMDAVLAARAAPSGRSTSEGRAAPWPGRGT